MDYMWIIYGYISINYKYPFVFKITYKYHGILGFHMDFPLPPLISALFWTSFLGVVYVHIQMQAFRGKQVESPV